MTMNTSVLFETRSHGANVTAIYLTRDFREINIHLNYFVRI